MNAVALSAEERELADRLCESLAAKHAFGRRVTIELRVEDLRVVEAFAHIRIGRGESSERGRDVGGL